jgi:hypothetical protein
MYLERSLFEKLLASSVMFEFRIAELLASSTMMPALLLPSARLLFLKTFP